MTPTRTKKEENKKEVTPTREKVALKRPAQLNSKPDPKPIKNLKDVKSKISFPKVDKTKEI